MAGWNDDSRMVRLVDVAPAAPRTIESAQLSRIGFHSNHIGFTLRTLDDDRLIGYINLFDIEWNNGAGQLGMAIGNEADRGKGYGTEALRLMLRYAFTELNLYRLGLDVLAYNERAISAYERVGFRREGAVREAVHHDGQRVDLIFMGILRDEWQS